jgi:hypothetical protein
VPQPAAASTTTTAIDLARRIRKRIARTAALDEIQQCSVADERGSELPAPMIRLDGMGPSRSVTTFAACVAVLTASSAAASAPAPSCFPKGAKTLAATKAARVFETKRGTYGCLYKYGRARRLDPGSDATDTQETAVKPFRLAGPYLAYPREVSVGCGPDLCVWTEIVVADLRPTKRFIVQSRHAMRNETGQCPCGGGEIDDDFVPSLVLRPSGVVAWIACDGDLAGPCDSDLKTNTSVFTAAPTQRAAQQLDHGAGIGIRSLRWANGQFHWQQDGQPRSAASP